MGRDVTSIAFIDVVGFRLFPYFILFSHDYAVVNMV